MNRLSSILALAACVAANAEPEAVDMLRLSDGELAGHFAGITADGTVQWNRDDGVNTLEFKQDKIRQIVLRGGGTLDTTADTSHITLANGDRLPAKIVSMDAENITLETLMAGKVVVPRKAVASLQPNPFGGRLLYAGPFSEEGWEIRSPGGKKADEGDGDEAEADEEKPDEEAEEKPASWRHVGAKWYFTGGSDAIRRDVGMTSNSLVRFKMEWRARPPIAIALFSDFAERPEAKAEDDEPEDGANANGKVARIQQIRRISSSSDYAPYFGNSLVLTLRSSYAQLLHCGFDEDGNSFADQISPSSSSVRFDETGSAEFEVRVNREAGTVALFVNGNFAIQWHVPAAVDQDKGIPDGKGIGFATMGSDTPLRISDIVVAEWNGMPDSARSFESEEFDTVLLTNGTDRFSGKAQSIENGALKIQGRYAVLDVPLEEVAQICFAGTPEEEESPQQGVRIHFQPIGNLSGEAGRTEDGVLQLRSPLLGELKVDLSSAVLLEFESGQGFLNYWDEDL